LLSTRICATFGCNSHGPYHQSAVERRNSLMQTILFVCCVSRRLDSVWKCSRLRSSEDSLARWCSSSPC